MNMKRSQLKRLIKEVVNILQEGYNKATFYPKIEREGEEIELTVKMDYYIGSEAPDDPSESHVVLAVDGNNQPVELSMSEDEDVRIQFEEYLQAKREEAQSRRHYSSGDEDYS